jgi:lipopolysaccharide transport system permease protein
VWPTDESRILNEKTAETFGGRVAMTVAAPVDERATPPARVRIDSRRRWFPDLKSTVRARQLLFVMSRRNITVQYRQTVLGVVWAFASPLVSAGLFTFVFGTVANLKSGGVPYFAFAYSGLLAWNLFSDTINGASRSFSANSNLVSKIYFPRLILPLATVGTALINAGITLGIMALLLVIYHIGFTLHLLLLPVWLLLALLLALSLGLISTSLGVTYRDVNYVTPTLVSSLLYLTPVAYAANQVPNDIRPLYLLNPMAPIVEACRWSLLGQGDVSLLRIGYAVAFVAITFVASLVVFARLEWGFADVI